MIAPKIEATLKATEETNIKIDAFSKNTDRAERVMNEIQSHISLFTKRAKIQD